jgi:hypothetical protein
MAATKKKATKAKAAGKKATKPVAKKATAAKQPEISSDLRKVALAHALRRLK